MSEQEIRDVLAEVDKLRKRAAAINDVTESLAWGLSEVSIEHVITIKRWPRSKKTYSHDITLTRDQRIELDHVLIDKARELRREADALAASLTQTGENPK